MLTGTARTLSAPSRVVTNSVLLRMCMARWSRGCTSMDCRKCPSLVASASSRAYVRRAPSTTIASRSASVSDSASKQSARLIDMCQWPPVAYEMRTCSSMPEERAQMVKHPVDSSKSLEGSLAVITGAGQGVWQWVATALSRAGASVLIIGRRARKLEAAAEALRADGGRVATLAVDIAADGTAEKIVETATAEFGGLDILVNHANVDRKSTRLNSSHVSISYAVFCL